MTQAQIGQRLRISQMRVSRLRTHALGYLRLRLLDLDGTRANARPALAPRSPAGRASATSANRLIRRSGFTCTVREMHAAMSPDHVYLRFFT
jgi:hypothetical protein